MLYSRSYREFLASGRPLAPIGGGIDTKPAADITERYVRIASGRQADYAKGIDRTPDTKWESRTAAGAANWAAGVAAAAAAGMFLKGVTPAGPKWKRKASGVGPARFATGVAAAGPDYTAGFAPYLAALGSLTLGPRGPRGDPANQQRSNAVQVTLHQARLKK